MRPIVPLTLLLALPAHAKRPDAPTVAKVPSIEEVVAAEGFTPTPSQSEIYKPGAVLVPNGRGGHDVVVSSCIDAEPDIAIMSQSSIATTLAGGVSARLGVARGAASAGVEKRLSFVDPEQRTIPLAKLRPTDECTGGVQTAGTFQDLSSAIVLHDVLVAIIKNTRCTKVDASGGVVALGAAEAAAYSECVQESDGQVPLGYKSVPLSKVLSLAGSPAPVPTARPPVSPRTPAAASASVDFGGMGSVDVDARLQEQACMKQAEEKGSAARQARLDAAAREVQAQATSAWQEMKASLQKCTQLPRADRTDCIAMAEKWLEAAEEMNVSLAAGVETVETECGERQPAFPIESLRVEAREEEAAKALRKRLEAPDTVSLSTPQTTGAQWSALGVPSYMGDAPRQDAKDACQSYSGVKAEAEHCAAQCHVKTRKERAACAQQCILEMEKQMLACWPACFEWRDKFISEYQYTKRGGRGPSLTSNAGCTTIDHLTNSILYDQEPMSAASATCVVEAVSPYLEAELAAGRQRGFPGFHCGPLDDLKADLIRGW